MPCSLDDYEVLSTIGSGSYGVCKKVRKKKDGKIYVWKEMDYGKMTESEKQMLVSEVNLLRELKHQHIVRYYDRIIDRSTTTLYIIMEYCEGGDLATFIAKLKKDGRTSEEAFVWKICYQVVSALKECHCRNKNGKSVLHRDLKPANVFLDGQTDVKLGDFGLARVLSHETSFAKTFVGTPYYMSPEQMNMMSYNEKSDVWSLGCMLYELCALRPPFMASNQRDLASRICTGHFQRLPVQYSDDLNEIISMMLRVEEFRRPTIDQILEHKLMQKHRPPDKRSSSGSDEGYRERFESLRRKEQTLLDHEQILQSREKMIADREKLLGECEKRLAEREADNLKREQHLSEKERLLKLKEQDLESREKTIQLREKMTDDRLARVDKLLESPRPQLESTRKINLRSASATELGDREPGEIATVDVSDTGRTRPLPVPNKSPSCVRDARGFKLGGGDMPTKSSPRSVISRGTSHSSALANLVNSPVTAPRKPSCSENRASKERSGWRIRRSSGNGRNATRKVDKENILPENFRDMLSPVRRSYVAADDQVFDSQSPRLRAKILSSPVVERKLLDMSPRPARRDSRPLSGSPQLKPHRPYPLSALQNLKDDCAEIASKASVDKTSLSPKTCAIDTGSDCALKEKVRRLLRKSPPDLYSARKDQRIVFQPLQKFDSVADS